LFERPRLPPPSFEFLLLPLDFCVLFGGALLTGAGLLRLTLFDWVPDRERLWFCASAGLTRG
jgi:hypothetical protein